MVIMSKSGKSFLLLVSSGLVVIFLFAAWTVSHTGKMTSFQFVRTVICDEVDESFNPLGISNNFDPGTRQLCLWFEYYTDFETCNLNIRWYYRDLLVSSENLVIQSPRGRKSFCLLREDGAPLPSGSYEVNIGVNGKNYTDLEFSITDTNPTSTL